MLVVSRYPEQAIRIGTDVTVKVIRVGDRRVLVGVDAPRSVPVRREEVLQSATEPAPVPEAAQRLRVLVVEDTQDHARLIERTLANCAAIETVTVSSGEDAIRLIRLGEQDPGLKPDLILLDLHLPDLSGLAVLDYVRTRACWHTTPVVMLSATNSEAEVTRCLEMGANAFVSKCDQQQDFRQSIYRIADFWSHCRKVG